MEKVRMVAMKMRGRLGTIVTHQANDCMGLGEVMQANRWNTRVASAVEETPDQDPLGGMVMIVNGTGGGALARSRREESYSPLSNHSGLC
jgi:hypothetical protein